MKDWKTTACILCECNCGLQVELGGEDNRHFVRLRGDKAHPSSQGYACEKAHRLDYYQNGRDRITSPMRRRADGTYEEISWETAISEVAQRLSKVRDDHGGESIFYYGGGGQGNHLPGAYASATRRLLGSRYRSNALAQEKTGEFWVSDRMLGTYTRGDFEHCEVGMFLGKNPWHSHSIARARVTLKELSKDPDRTMIVIDPRRSETAAMADIHLQVRPGTDAWLLAAMVGIIVRDDLVDHAFVEQHTEGVEAVLAAFREIPIEDYCARTGVDTELVVSTVHRIAKARSFASFEDLGVQMNHHSTLVSYLHRLVWLLTGNLGKQGAQYVPTPLVSLAGEGGKSERRSPVADAPIIAGLVPCNVIAEEILTEHPKRYRAMIVEAANPAHSLADSQRFREALGSLDTLVVIDVAMTETARLADYVLPASTQYEKAEATFFNFEFPENCFQLRPRIVDPPPGPLSEAEIHARLVEALGGFTAEQLEPLHAAAQQGRAPYAAAFMQHVLGNRALAGLAPVLLYRTLGPTLPDSLREGAVIWGAAFRAALSHGKSLARAGFDGPPPIAADKLFNAVLENPSGLVFSVDEWADVIGRVRGGKVKLALPDLLEEAATLRAAPAQPPADFPFVLSAGERRSMTANTIVRNPEWRNKKLQHALNMNPKDAADLAVATGERVVITTKRGQAVVTVAVSEMMQPGHVSLPNGLGVTSPGESDGPAEAGIAPNELTASEDRDRFAGTPWHKHVPARIERYSGAEQTEL